MFYDILDEKRMGILPMLKPFKERFYLAGGTGLALQIGHRDSADFDFFMDNHFDTPALYAHLTEAFRRTDLLKTLEEKDSLTVIVAGEVRLSFLRYPYALLNPCMNEENLRIASIEDTGCMKLSAVVSRAVEKDFVDLYVILKKIPLKELLVSVKKKMPDLDANLVLKSLVYFDDIAEEKIKFRHGFKISLDEVRRFMEEQVKMLM